MKVKREMIKEWCGSFEEAVDLIYSVLNNGTDKDDIVESLEHHYIDCGLMSEEEFRERCV